MEIEKIAVTYRTGYKVIAEVVPDNDEIGGIKWMLVDLACNHFCPEYRQEQNHAWLRLKCQ